MLLFCFEGTVTSTTRDHQALVDLLVDFFCVAFPLIVLYFVTRLPIDIETMLQITLLPTLGIYTKLNAVQRQFIVEDLRSMRYDAENDASTRASRRRMSLYGAKHEVVVIERQKRYFTSTIQKAFGTLHGLYGCFLLALLTTQIVQLQVGDENCTARATQLCGVTA